jgi:hypothetical protein
MNPVSPALISNYSHSTTNLSAKRVSSGTGSRESVSWVDMTTLFAINLGRFPSNSLSSA